jgi:hypothetical protein
MKARLEAAHPSGSVKMYPGGKAIFTLFRKLPASLAFT